VLQLAPPGESENTVDRATLDAAVTRIFGNDKIPDLNYGTAPAPPSALFAENRRLKALTTDQQKKIFALVGEIPSTANTVDAQIAQYTAIRAELLKLVKLYQSLQSDVRGKSYTDFIDEVDRGVALVQALIEDIDRQYISVLRQIKQRSQA
jgi:hypothetical protein